MSTSRRIEGGLGLALAIITLAAVPGCDRSPSLKYTSVDAPPKPPPEVAAPTPPAGEGSAKASACVPGTGRNDAGECVPLQQREREHAVQVALPAGAFVMGDMPLMFDAQATRAQVDTRWSSNPLRRVEVDGFWLDLHEVTRGAYEACVTAGECTPAACPDDVDPVADRADHEALPLLPQTCVTHGQAKAFCRAHGARLPTEQEWEYAARGVDGRIYPWGNQIRDELRAGLSPVTVAHELSYFGLRGMGSNAREWVAEPFEPDAGLAPFSSGSFRADDGPLAQLLSSFPDAHVVKYARAGRRIPGFVAEPMIGFRCAADLGDDDVELEVPDAPPPVAVARRVESLEVFVGVAEVVQRDEAKAFCDAVALEGRDDWRLPSLAEVQALGPVFLGPGPFWTRDGAAVQQGEGPSAPWVAEQAKPDEPLAARCVRELDD